MVDMLIYDPRTKEWQDWDKVSLGAYYRCKHNWFWTVSATPCAGEKPILGTRWYWCDCRTHETEETPCRRPYTAKDMVQALLLLKLQGVEV